ncbi:hypothetical protein BU17DRAFT_85247 [Hysterangium stoloniferum]|nr:hypothetical protein BU17DRAFT_85247 [Hysterangium stoloniferum]
MSSRTSRWATQVRPGPPAPSSRAPSIGPPPTVYPESSVSNPDASRYTGRSSRARSASVTHPPSHHESHYTSSSRSSPRHSARSSRSSTPTPSPTYYAPPGQPVIARTSDSRGRTDSYVILPPRGQKVEIVHPTPIRSSYSSSPYYPPSSPRSPTRERPLIRRLLDKVEWNSDKNSRRSSSVSHSSAPSYRGSRTRRNSTGGDDQDWAVSGGHSRNDHYSSDHYSRRSVDSGSRGTITTVTRGRRTYDIIQV